MLLGKTQSRIRLQSGITSYHQILSTMPHIQIQITDLAGATHQAPVHRQGWPCTISTMQYIQIRTIGLQNNTRRLAVK